jgi:hypothetical protein
MLGRRAVIRGSCALAAFVVLQAVPVAAQEITSTPDPTVTTLERDKLAWEIAKLKQEEARLRFANEQPVIDLVRNNAIVIVGLAGGLFTLWRWRVDRVDDRRKRDEDRLSAVVDGLGSPNELTRINAAHNLHTFLEPGYERFSTRILHLVVAHLRHQSQPKNAQLPLVTLGLITVSRRQPQAKRAELPLFTQALCAVFKDAYPRARPKQRALLPVLGGRKREAEGWWRAAGSSLDMNEIQLPGAYLVNTDLSNVWMPYANLTGANFFGTTLTGACFRSADLTRVYFRSADLTQANLQSATLTGAKLIGATLTGADLTGADLSGVKGLTPEQRQLAVEQGAILDEPDPPR